MINDNVVTLFSKSWEASRSHYAACQFLIRRVLSAQKVPWLFRSRITHRWEDEPLRSPCPWEWVNHAAACSYHRRCSGHLRHRLHLHLLLQCSSPHGWTIEKRETSLVCSDHIRRYAVNYLTSITHYFANPLRTVSLVSVSINLLLSLFFIIVIPQKFSIREIFIRLLGLTIDRFACTIRLGFNPIQ